jgi:hypothetical protein
MNMKSFLPLLAIAVAGALSLAACTDPIPLRQDPTINPPQIHVTDYWLQNDIYGQTVSVHRVGAGQLEVAVRLYNKRDWEKQVDYRYRFLSQSGAEVEAPSGWHALRIEQRGYTELKFTSMTAQAADFDVQVRPVR